MNNTDEALDAIAKAFDESEPSFSSEVMRILNLRRETANSILALQTRINYLIGFYERETQLSWDKETTLYAGNTWQIKLRADNVWFIEVRFRESQIVPSFKDLLIAGEAYFGKHCSLRPTECQSLSNIINDLSFDTLRSIFCQ